MPFRYRRIALGSIDLSILNPARREFAQKFYRTISGAGEAVTRTLSAAPEYNLSESEDKNGIRD